MHSPHLDVWRQAIPQPWDPKVEPSFGLYFSPHHPVHSAGYEAHPHNAVHRQDPHAHPSGLGKELATLKISNEREIRYLETKMNLWRFLNSWSEMFG